MQQDYLKLIRAVFSVKKYYIATIVLFLLIGKTVHAEELDLQNDGMVLVESEKASEVSVEKLYDASLPYKQRRKSQGVLFAVLTEKFYPIDYLSLFKDAFVEDILDSSRIDLFGAEIGYKRNFSLGSAALLLGYAQGKKTGTVANFDRTLDITRTALSLNFALDNITSEPWVVPYVQGGMHTISVKETQKQASGLSVSKSGNSGMDYNYRAGLLFQLNWIESSIDPATHTQGIRSSGLENTFIDIYVADHTSLGNHYDATSPDGEGVPNLRTGAEMGIGLKLEF